MLKALRKYNKWILVIGGTLLMLAFLVQPAIQQLGGDPGSRLWATMDGKRLRLRDAGLAGKEIDVIRRLTMGAYPDSLGLEEKDPVRHWVLLVHEARRAGFVGEAEDGGAWLPELLAELEMQRQFRGMDWRAFARSNPGVAQYLGQQFTDAVDRNTRMTPDLIADTAGRAGMSVQQVHGALSKVRGVLRMYDAYVSAARVSDRRAAVTGRERGDSAFVDVCFIPASIGAGAVPDPDDAALAEFFERHKAIKPGEGEHGIGYLLPDRVKLEWLTLDATAIRGAIELDPVAVNKRYLQDNKRKYTGDFAAERVNVERDMKEERLGEVMQEAHRAIQAEVLKVTRRLESDGGYKRLPADWEAQRPKLEAIAPLVVEQVKKATGVTIPLPTVHVRAADWVTRQTINTLEGVGVSSLRTGNLDAPFAEVLFRVRELRPPEEAEMTIPLQAGVPMVEGFFTGDDGSRHYITVLDARRESAPDSAAEIRDQVAGDSKRVRAYEALATRAEEFQSLVASEGFAKLLDAVAPGAGAPPAEGRPEVKSRVRVSRDRVSGDGGASVDAQPFREAVMAAAAGLDPLMPPDQFDPQKTVISVALPSKLGVAVARITALQPLTREQLRLVDPSIVAVQQQDELMPEEGEPADLPFSLARLMQRHTFVSDDADREQEEGKPGEAPVSSGG